MSFSPDLKPQSKYQTQIERNKKFEATLDENLKYFRDGFLSPRELLRTLTTEFSNTDANVKFPGSEFPFNTLLVQRRFSSRGVGEIQVHDPFANVLSEYNAVTLAANKNKLYPSLVVSHPEDRYRTAKVIKDKTVGSEIIKKFIKSSLLR